MVRSKFRDRSGFFVTIFSFVGSFLVRESVHITSQAIFNTVISGAVARLQFAVSELFGGLQRVVSLLGRALRHILSDIIHLRFLHLWQDYLRLTAAVRRWYERHFGWLIDLRRRFDAWFRRTVLPILNFLQNIRRILAVFRIFHLKFAEKLDRSIARLESRIIRNTLVLRQKINEVLTWANLILDPLRLIRQNPLWPTFVHASDSLLKLLTGRGLRDRLAHGRGTRGPFPRPQRFREVQRELARGMSSPTSDLAAIRDQVRQTFADLDQELGSFP